jgi:hypothetical protein
VEDLRRLCRGGVREGEEISGDRGFKEWRKENRK